MTPRNQDELLHGLQELEASTSEAIKAQRGSVRYTSTTRVWVRPGNASDRVDQAVIEGTTADISEGGCKLLTGSPLVPGDLYLLSFDRKDVDLPPIFGRCMRSRLIDEDAFEAGMKFFTKVDLKALVEGLDDLPELV